MAAGFTLKKISLKILKFIIKRFFKRILNKENRFLIMMQKFLLTAFNKDFYNDIRKLEPFGKVIQITTFLFKRS